MLITDKKTLSEYKNIWILTETDNGNIHSSAFELIGEAKRLSKNHYDNQHNPCAKSKFHSVSFPFFF